MSSPTENSWNALKRLCRYLAGLPRLVYTYGWQDVDVVDVYTDTDWAGCPRTRKSTSGGCVMLGKHTIKTWSATQSSVSLSSGEAEFNGVVRGAGMGLGFQSLMRDLGQDAPVRVWTDSEAAIGISSRQGLGKLRHLDTHTLWTQHAVRSGRIDLRKVLGEANPADIFTKHSLSRERLKMLTELFDCKFRGGRPDAAPRLREVPSNKLTMADTCVAEVEARPSMPHLEHSKEELERFYPCIPVPKAVDDGDPQAGEQEPLLEEGLRLAKDLVKSCEEQGRRRRLAE